MYAKVKHDNDFSASNYELVYRFEITTLEPFDQLEVMIDANTGNLIRKLTMIENAAGTVNTLYNGQRSFTTQWRGWPNNDYVLKDTDSGDKLHTLLYSESTAWEFRPEVDDDDKFGVGQPLRPIGACKWHGITLLLNIAAMVWTVPEEK